MDHKFIGFSYGVDDVMVVIMVVFLVLVKICYVECLNVYSILCLQSC